jgi:HPr kinase/phosphorylase
LGVVTRSLPVLPVILAAAERYEVPFFRTKEQTSSFMASLISTLKIELAPRITRHGVLMGYTATACSSSEKRRGQK